MKRNMCLIREMLLAVEAEEHGFALQKIEIPGYTREQVNYHTVLLGEAGFVEIYDVTAGTGGGAEAIITRLTWAGHDFLDTARNPEIWNLVKEVIGKIGGASLDIWKALLTAHVKSMLDI
jgi:hypothetical protein